MYVYFYVYVQIKKLLEHALEMNAWRVDNYTQKRGENKHCICMPSPPSNETELENSFLMCKHTPGRRAY